MRRLAPALLFLALAACERPPAEAFVTSAREAARAVDAGQDLQGQPCLARPAAGAVAAARAWEVFCGGWTQPAARVLELDGPADPARLRSLAAAGAWRGSLEGRISCEAPQEAGIRDNRAGIVMACRRRVGGWPHIALVAAGARGPVLADGLPSALPAVERLATGATTPAPIRSAAVQLAAARLAGERFGADQVGRYEALITLGAELNQAENFAAAADAYRAALAIQDGVLGPNHPDSVTAVLHLALNLSNLGREAEATPLFAQAARLAPLASDPVAPARLLHYRGLDAANRNQPEEAARLLGEAERRYAALVPAGLATARQRSIAEEVAPALALDNVAQSALLGLVEVQRNRGVALARRGEADQAARLAAQSRGLMQRAGLTEGVVIGRSLRSEGMAREAVGRAEAQGLYAQAARSFGGAQPGERPEAVTLFLSGARLSATGRGAEALEEFRRGAAILRARQLGLPVSLVQPYLDLLEERARTDAAHLPEMFAAMQLARRDGTARLTAQASARLAAGDGNQGVTRALRGMQDADRRLRALLLEREAPGRDRDAGLSERIAEARRERDAAEDEAAAAAPGYRQLVLGSAEAREAAAALAPDEALFVMLAGPQHTHVMALRADGRAAARRVPMGEAEMDALVRRVREGLVTGRAARPFDAAAAHALHEALVAPLGPMLDGASSLVIVADGPMLRLPFALLPERPEDGRGAPWLVRRFALSHVPSPQALVSLRRGQGASAAPLPYAGFGDPVTPTAAQLRSAFPAERCRDDAEIAALLPPLPGTRAEVNVAARLLRAGPDRTRLGEAFTPAAVRGLDLGRHRVVHFATHTVLPGELSCLREPALLASAPRGAGDTRAALITASDVMEMRLDADLVILSACNTAVGPGGGDLAGEGLAGLARAFFYAGTRGVLATHWAVDDLASAVTVADLLQRQERGTRGPQALREAQLLLLDGAGGRFPAEFAHPAWWAPFALIGDGRREGQTRLATR